MHAGGTCSDLSSGQKQEPLDYEQVLERCRGPARAEYGAERSAAARSLKKPKHQTDTMSISAALNCALIGSCASRARLGSAKHKLLNGV
ncbi:Uncharacterized protein DAT39_011007 [Clarias magur]|uniref:Uncharacterized protein n=1 Tax=Clarias magur TaxID=1594786 RepID=A0A8J4XDQ6_CLAMG|nr:Uncharacterized protein DAT39_011007 [Clarias magur]